MNAEYPHGVCECDTGVVGGCCLGDGPAAVEVTRDGKQMRLCTRCDLSTDLDKKVLVTKEDDFAVYVEFDALGALCLAGRLEEATQCDTDNRKPWTYRGWDIGLVVTDRGRKRQRWESSFPGRPCAYSRTKAGARAYIDKCILSEARVAIAKAKGQTQ